MDIVGNAGFRAGTVLDGDDVSLNTPSSNRVNAANPSNTYLLTLEAGVDYHFTTFAGGSSTAANVQFELLLDTDGDGVFNHLDLDSDNDGISDLVESGQDQAIVDTNNDGVHDSVADATAVLTGDTDNDGLADVADSDNGGTDVTPRQTDSDGLADFLDLDADNDGIADAIEARPTADGNVITAGGDAGDTDNDGVLDHFENATTEGGHGANFATPQNTDALINNNPDANPDYIDTDSDGDSLLDSIESGLVAITEDNNGDGIDDLIASTNNISYNDADGNIVPSSDLNNEIADNSEVAFREITDTDSDGIADAIDVDDDNDGILDTVEGPTRTETINANGATTASFHNNNNSVTLVSSGSGSVGSNVGGFANELFFYSEDALVGEVYQLNFATPVLDVELAFTGVNFDAPIGNFTVVCNDGTTASNLDVSLSLLPIEISILGGEQLIRATDLGLTNDVIGVTDPIDNGCLLYTSDAADE